jgi:serine/threonine protein kinase
MKGGNVKLGDLGLSKILESKTDLQSQRVGTPIYFAPELIQHLPYSFGIDVWALGCVFYTLVNFSHPFDGATLETLAYFILTKGPWPLKSCIYSAQLVRFVFELMEKNSNNRPDIEKALKNIELAQTAEAVSRVSVYNSKMLSSLVQESPKPKMVYNKIEDPLTYRRMKVKAAKDESLDEGDLEY